MSDIPRLTDAEAALLRLCYLVHAEVSMSRSVHQLALDGLLGEQYRDGKTRRVTERGQEELRAYDAQKRAEIEAPLRERIARMRDLLRSLEWSDSISINGDDWNACPMCSELERDKRHTPGCFMARELEAGE